MYNISLCFFHIQWGHFCKLTYPHNTKYMCLVQYLLFTFFMLGDTPSVEKAGMIVNLTSLWERACRTAVKVRGKQGGTLTWDEVMMDKHQSSLFLVSHRDGTLQHMPHSCTAYIHKQGTALKAFCWYHPSVTLRSVCKPRATTTW